MPRGLDVIKTTQQRRVRWSMPSSEKLALRLGVQREVGDHEALLALVVGPVLQVDFDVAVRLIGVDAITVLKYLQSISYMLPPGATTNCLPNDTANPTSGEGSSSLASDRPPPSGDA